MLDLYIEDYTGIFESILNAETAWGNIMKSAMINEYKAIKNEDINLLEDNQNNFFKEIKLWFKNLLDHIIGIISNIKNKIILKFNSWSKNVKIIKNFIETDFNRTDEKTGETSFNTHSLSDIKKSFKFYENYDSLLSNISEMISNLILKTNDIKDKVKSGIEKAKEYYYDDKNDMNYELSHQKKDIYFKSEKDKKPGLNYNETMKLIKEAKIVDQDLSLSYFDFEKYINDLDNDKYKTIIKKNLENFEEAKKACKEGIKATEKKNKNLIKYFKNYSSYLNLLSSQCLNLLIKNFSIKYNFIMKYYLILKDYINNRKKANNYFTQKDKDFLALIKNLSDIYDNIDNYLK